MFIIGKMRELNIEINMNVTLKWGVAKWEYILFSSSSDSWLSVLPTKYLLKCQVTMVRLGNHFICTALEYATTWKPHLHLNFVATLRRAHWCIRQSRCAFYLQQATVFSQLSGVQWYATLNLQTAADSVSFVKHRRRHLIATLNEDPIRNMMNVPIVSHAKFYHELFQ